MHVCNTLVVKVASRCNLNCTYCYMYNAGDNSWKKQPKVMSHAAIIKLGKRIAEHCTANGLRYFTVVMHGGEPLLAGMEFFRDFTNTLRNCLGAEVKLQLLVQTNATLLTEEWCELFEELHIAVGVSLDGEEEVNDKHRIYHSGKGSYQDTIRGLKISQQSVMKHKPGVLSVIDINADPVGIYRHLQSLGVKSANFLLPDNNYYHPLSPPLLDTASEAPYANWLIKIFDIWFEENDEERIQVSHFMYLIEMLLGAEIGTEMFGTQYNGILVIETDGGIEATDTLKSCGEEFTKSGANIFNTSFDEALETPLAKMYVHAHKFLPRKCVTCPVNSVCGGGLIQTRYSKTNGFNNPSIYCNDYLKLIIHVQNRLLDSLPEEVVAENEIEKLSLHDEMARFKASDHDSSPLMEYEQFISNF